MNLPSDEKIYWLAFARLSFIGPVKFNQILKYFGSAKKAWTAPADEYLKFGWNDNQLNRYREIQRSFNPEKESKQLKDKEIKIFAVVDEDYPKNLKEIPDPPFLIFIRGEILPEDRLSLAVVGSRKMTSYGYQVLETLVPELVLAGVTIVSGLAFGVDYAVHKLVLESGGRAIAVLASGVDEITPRSNERLGEAIISRGSGAIISELPPGTQPQPHFFPVRNRIISGLSTGTLVVEAAAKSGSLYTAEAALEQGREVFAIPGSIFNPLSAGTTGLIRAGAKVVTQASDILEELDAQTTKAHIHAAVTLPSDPGELKMLEILGMDEKHVDLLAKESGCPISEVNSSLMSLELKGLVKNLGGGVYRASRWK